MQMRVAVMLVCMALWAGCREQVTMLQSKTDIYQALDEWAEVAEAVADQCWETCRRNRTRPLPL